MTNPKDAKPENCGCAISPSTCRARASQMGCYLRLRTAGWGSGDEVGLFQLFDQHVVDLGADHLDDLVAEVLVHRLVPTKASSLSVHHQWNSAPPSPQSRRFHSRSVDVTWPFSSVCRSRRSGSCQHTSGFQSRALAGVERARCAARSRRRRSKPGRLRKMQAPSSRRVTMVSPSLFGRRTGPPRSASSWNCHCSGLSRSSARRRPRRRRRRRSGRRSCSSPA